MKQKVEKSGVAFTQDNQLVSFAAKNIKNIIRCVTSKKTLRLGNKRVVRTINLRLLNLHSQNEPPSCMVSLERQTKLNNK